MCKLENKSSTEYVRNIPRFNTNSCNSNEHKRKLQIMSSNNNSKMNRNEKRKSSKSGPIGNKRQRLSSDTSEIGETKEAEELIEKFDDGRLNVVEKTALSQNDALTDCNAPVDTSDKVVCCVCGNHFSSDSDDNVSVVREIEYYAEYGESYYTPLEMDKTLFLWKNNPKRFPMSKEQVVNRCRKVLNQNINYREGGCDYGTARSKGLEYYLHTCNTHVIIS